MDKGTKMKGYLMEIKLGKEMKTLIKGDEVEMINLKTKIVQARKKNVQWILRKQCIIFNIIQNYF